MRALSIVMAAVLLAALLVISGCSNAPPEDSRAGSGTLSPRVTGPMDQPLEDVPPATAPPGSVMPGQVATDEGLARWDGFGEAQFGMDGEQVEMVWPGELNGEAFEGSSCYHLNPLGDDAIAHFAMMFEDGPFVRYSVSNEDITAPGGGMLGMDMAQIEGLYPDRVEQSGHEYVIGGRYLRIKEEGGEHVLLFETDESGTVTEWRVGLPPQVDYSEGCG